MALHCHDRGTYHPFIIFLDIFSCILPQPPQNITVEQCIGGLTKKDDLLKDNSFKVKETDELELQISLYLLGFLGTGWQWTLPLRKLLLGFRIIPLNPAFIISYNLQKKVCLSLRSHSTNFTAICLMFNLLDKILWHIPYESRIIAHVLNLLGPSSKEQWHFQMLCQLMAILYRDHHQSMFFHL